MKTGFVISEREHKKFLKTLDRLAKKQTLIATSTAKKLNSLLTEVESLKEQFQNGDSPSSSNASGRQSGKKRQSERVLRTETPYILEDPKDIEKWQNDRS